MEVLADKTSAGNIQPMNNEGDEEMQGIDLAIEPMPDKPPATTPEATTQETPTTTETTQATTEEPQATEAGDEAMDVDKNTASDETHNTSQESSVLDLSTDDLALVKEKDDDVPAETADVVANAATSEANVVESSEILDVAGAENADASGAENPDIAGIENPVVASTEDTDVVNTENAENESGENALPMDIGDSQEAVPNNTNPENIDPNSIALDATSEIINLADLPPEVQIENLQAAGLTPEQIAALLNQAQVEGFQLGSAEEGQNIQLIGGGEGQNLQTLVTNEEGNLELVDVNNQLAAAGNEQGEAVENPAGITTENIDISGGLTAENLQALMASGNLQIVNLTQDGVENPEMADLSGAGLPENLKDLASQVMAGNLQIVNFPQEGGEKEEGDGQPMDDQSNNMNLQMLAQQIMSGNLQIVDLSEQAGQNDGGENAAGTEGVVGEGENTNTNTSDGTQQPTNPDTTTNLSIASCNVTDSMSAIPVTCSAPTDHLSDVITSDQESDGNALSINVPAGMGGESQQKHTLLPGGGQGFTEAKIDAATGQIVFSEPSMNTNSPVPQGTIIVPDNQNDPAFSQSMTPMIVTSQQATSAGDMPPALQQIQAQVMVLPLRPYFYCLHRII